jgi:hypothetical protein
MLYILRKFFCNKISVGVDKPGNFGIILAKFFFGEENTDL